QVPTATDVACIGSTAGPVVLNSGLAKVFTVGSVFVDPGSSLTIGGSILYLDDARATSIISSLAITNYYGGIDGPGSIEIPTAGTWTWTNGELRGLGSVTVDAGASATFDPVDGSISYARHISVNGHLTLTTAGATSGGLFITHDPASGTDTGGLLVASGAVDIDVTAADLQIGAASAAAIDFAAVTTGHAIGGHQVLLAGITGGLGGSWTVDPGIFFKLFASLQAITVTANVAVGAGSFFVIGSSDAHLMGIVSGAGTFCQEYSTLLLDNTEGLESIAQVDTGECNGTQIGAGRVSVARGATARVKRLRTSFDSSITGGGTLVIVGDGDPATTDLLMGGNYGRGGFGMQDATVEVAHGASASFGSGATETLYPPDATAPPEAMTTFVNHGTFTWNAALLTIQPRTKFDNAADGVLNIAAAKAVGGGLTTGLFGVSGTFTNEGVMTISSGDFEIDGHGTGPSVLGGQVDVAAGSVLRAESPHITGTINLRAGTASTAGASLQASDNVVVDGTVQLGSFSTLKTPYDLIVNPTGVVHADIDGPQGASTGQILANRTAYLDGSLDVTTLAGYQPTTSPIVIVTAPTVTGTFASLTASPLVGAVWSTIYSPTTAGVVASAPPNLPPVVQAAITPSTGTIYAPATVHLDLTGTSDPDGSADLNTWSVSISDGATTTPGPSGDATTMFANHDITLPVTGQDTTFTITVTVTDHHGNSATGTATVTVLSPQVQASFTSSPVTSGSTDINFQPTVTGRDVALATQWTLDFGDVSDPAHGALPMPASIVHSYASVGTFTAKLTIRDAAGNVLATFSASAGTANQSPTAIFRLSEIPTTGDSPTLIYQSSTPKLPVRLSSSHASVVIDASPSFDSDPLDGIGSWDVQTLRGAVVVDHFMGSGPMTQPVTVSMPGGATTDTVWTVRVAVTDRLGATTVAQVAVTAPASQHPVTNRPPVAILATTNVNSSSGGVVSADPG
ncbi:MAG: beta strand repeat-containing protein, partial [Ilumatobacteraceae bacterium]